MTESSLDRARSRRQFVKGAVALGALAAAGTGGGVALWRSSSADGTGVAGGPTTLDELADSAVSGGPGKDGIPPIDEPVFVSASKAGFLKDEDVVFGLIHRGEVRAYPQLVLVWHEVVNDVIADEPISVTYCPLTGSTVGFTARGGGRRLSTFGTTGKLVNSNLLMYDRTTDSEWPQILATAISGSRKGARLSEVPLVWTTWGRWKTAHPETAVLSTDTGFGRSYGDDPYGSYAPPGGYYTSGGPLFEVTPQSDRFEAKEVVVGVKVDAARAAIPKRSIEERRVIPFDAGGEPLLAVWDDRLATARIFVRESDGRSLRFEEGELRDSTGTTWASTGRAQSGPLRGARLGAIPFLDAMWFAWHAFFPGTAVVT